MTLSQTCAISQCVLANFSTNASALLVILSTVTTLALMESFTLPSISLFENHQDRCLHGKGSTDPCYNIDPSAPAPESNS